MHWLLLGLGAVLTGAGHFIVGPAIIGAALFLRTALQQGRG